MKSKVTLRDLLALIATILETPVDRLGRRDRGAAQGKQFDAICDAEKAIRVLAVENCLTPSRTTYEQVAKVIRCRLEQGR